MNYLNDGRWIPGGSDEEQDRAERKANRRQAAIAALKHAGREERPIEARVAGARDPITKAARQLEELSKVDPTAVRATLALERQGQEDADAGEVSDRVVRVADQLASDADDHVQAISDREDDVESFAEWVQENLGLTTEQYEAALEELGERGEAVREMIEEQYEREFEEHAEDGYEEDGYEEDGYEEDWEGDEYVDLPEVGDGADGEQ